MWDSRTLSGDRIALILLVLAAGILFLTCWDVGLNDDEGYLLGGVTRILDGQVLYRDFHHTYAPGRFYLVAALFRLAGEELLVVRALWLVLRIAIVLLAWFAARPILSRPGAIAFAAMMIVVPGPWHKSFFHFFLFANLITLGRLSRPGAGMKLVAAAGITAGVTLLFRQDLGLVAMGVYGLMLLCGKWTGETARRGAVFFCSCFCRSFPPCFISHLKGLWLMRWGRYFAPA